MKQEIHPLLKVKRNNQVLNITLNRPEKRNAISDELLLELEQLLIHLEPGIKCIIINGEGSHFSSGLDLGSLLETDLSGGIQHSQMWHRVMDKIQFGKVPVIAVLKGACIGGGLEIAGACHIRVAEESTFYALPEGQRGIYVGGGASVRLPKLIGLATMTDMLLTGRIVQAEEGYRLGFAQYLTPTDQGLEKAEELAEKICNNTDLTNFAILQVLPKISETTREQGLMMESLMAAIAQQSPEAKSRLQQFLAGKASKLTEQ